MTLPQEGRQFIGALAVLVLLLLVLRMIRHRSLADFQLFVFMALFTALYFLQILYLNLPLVDMILAIALGVTAGLHLLRFIRFKK